MNPACPIVVLDACVLYPAALRSLMMWLAVHELIRPKWMEQIHDEWMRNVLKDRPDVTRKQLERTRKLMDGVRCMAKVGPKTRREIITASSGSRRFL